MSAERSTSDTERFPLLLSPLRVGRRTFRNRVIMLPHGTLLADEHGLPTPDQAHYYAERAAGDVAAMVMGAAIVHPNSFAGRGQNALWKAEAVAGYRGIAEAVHTHGALMLSQLSFTGNKGPSVHHREALWAPSPIPYVGLREIPKEMSAAEIEDVIAAFVQAAVYLQAGDFDGVEVFAAQGYGLNQFLSPVTNKRSDTYGGNLESRLQIVVEILGRIREAVSPDFLVGVRLNGADLVEGGLTLGDAQAIARALEASGYVDYFNVSADMRGLAWIADMSAALAPFARLSQGIAQAVTIPVVCATRIKTPAQAETILASGQAELVGLARALIADPLWVQKAAQQPDDICICLSCNQDCLGRILQGARIGCVQNPTVGKEIEWGAGTLRPAEPVKRVMVVGGGPAGLEAARVAALRGHQVTLYEKKDRLGGQVTLASRITSRRELGEAVRFRERALARLDVTVALNVEVTPEMVLAQAPDVVVLATGSYPARTGFSAWRPGVETVPGTDLPHVLTSWDVLNGTREIGEHVLVVEEDPHLQACFVAEHLAEQGKRVHMITGQMYVGMDLPPAVLGPTFGRLLSKGVTMSPYTLLGWIEPGRVQLSNLFTGEVSIRAGIDSVVLVMGNVVDNRLYRPLAGRVPELYTVGDCVAPRLIGNAIYEGHKIGRAI